MAGLQKHVEMDLSIAVLLTEIKTKQNTQEQTQGKNRTTKQHNNKSQLN